MKIPNKVKIGGNVIYIKKMQREEITSEETTVDKRDPNKQVKHDDLNDFLEKLDNENIGWEFVAIPVGEIKPEQKEIKRVICEGYYE